MQAKREQSDSGTAAAAPKPRGVVNLKLVTKAIAGRPKEMFRATLASELHDSVQAMCDQALQVRVDPRRKLFLLERLSHRRRASQS